MDYFIHSITTGSLSIFSFFMISDPRTSPDHPFARILWASLIATASFYLAAFQWKYNTSIWVMVAAAPLVPVLDMLFKARPFKWSSVPLPFAFLKRVQPARRTGMQKTAGKAYFTRLHVRCNRKAFPQDLLFQETANTENYQARYIITHPATGDSNCLEGKKYLVELKQRRQDELEMLTHLTGRGACRLGPYPDR